MTFAGARSLGASIFSPACFFFSSSFQRIFVMILELFRLEVTGFGFDNVRGQLQHVFWNFFVRDIFEIFILFGTS
jgi:hypothetical protein